MASDLRRPTVVCPFCDYRIKSREKVIKCWNCGEAFETEEDYENEYL